MSKTYIVNPAYEAAEFEYFEGQIENGRTKGGNGVKLPARWDKEGNRIWPYIEIGVNDE